jgi:hypothetical protein
MLPLIGKNLMNLVKLTGTEKWIATSGSNNSRVVTGSV